MPAENPIFRKVALDRLSSPDQLDRLMQVTSPKGWIALWALACTLVVGLLWGVVGSIPTKVSGQGILIKGGTVFDIVSVGSGIVTQILCKAGSDIQTNQLIAVISQPELELRIRTTAALLEDLTRQNKTLRQLEQATLAIDADNLRQERTNLFTSITNYQRQLIARERKLANQREALDRGLIIESDLLATQIEIFSAEQEEARARQRLLQIAAIEIDRPMQMQQMQSARQQRIAETAGTLELLQKQLEITSQIRSPYSGTILELVVDSGNYIAAGTRLLSLETDAQLEAVIFTAADEGKRIKKGMDAQISPATVKKEESGFIRGQVTFVSSFPATPERMMRVLRNQDLVKQLSGAGAPIEVLVSLRKVNADRYDWSSSRNPIEITSGTLCNGAIVVKRSRPIGLLLPLLRETTGM